MIDRTSSDYEKWQYFDYCRKHHIAIRGTIIKYDERFGFTVDLLGIHADLNKWDLSYSYVPDFEIYVEKSFMFVITVSNQYSKRLRVSRKKVSDTYKQYDIVDGIIIKILQNRLDIDCGHSVRVHIRNIADRFINDIGRYYQVGQQLNCMLLDEHFMDATMKQSAIWEKKVEGLNKNDILNVHFVEQKEKGIVVSYCGLSLYIDYNFLTPEYQKLFNNGNIQDNDIISAAVSKIDYSARKIFLSMVLAEKIVEKEAKIKAKQKRQEAIEELKETLELGMIVEAIVKSVSRKSAIIQITGTDVECKIKREDLSPNKAINAEDEVFVGERIHVVYVGEEKGELIFKRNIIMQDIYESTMYDLSMSELLAKMEIRSSLFIGKVTKMGHDMFFTNVISKDDNPLENGKLLVDPQIGRSIFVLIPSNIVVEENNYYEFELKLASKSLRQKEGSPFMFSLGGSFKKCENPYKDLVALSFKQHTSPNTNTSVANLLEEVGQNLYTSKKRMFFELLQNADDAAPIDGVKVKIQIIGKYFVITHDGFAFNQHDFESITSAAKSTKRSNSKKTGYKGIGFKSVFTNSQSVFIKSLGFKFAFDKSLNTYNDFEKFYFLVNDIEDSPEKQAEFLHKYSKYYREFQGVKDIPWQLLPIWHEDLAIVPDEAIFNRDNNVAIALKMDDATLSEYGEAVREVFSQPRFMLFLRNTNRVQLLDGDVPLTIQKNKDEKNGIISLVNSFSDSSKLSEDYRIITVDNILVNDEAFSAAGVLMKREERTNNRGEIENFFNRIDLDGKIINEVSGIPDRIASTTDTTISFAVQLDESNRITPSDTGESSLYAYLPMNEHRFKFPFYINADFIPKSDREGIQSDNPWNHFLFYTIGKNIVMMIAQLASSSEPNYLELLLPSAFESNSQDTAALIDSFNRGYSNALQEVPFIINEEGNLVGTNNIILDNSGLSDEVSLSSFYSLLGTSKRLPHANLDSKILKNKIFNIEILSVNAVLKKLSSDIDGLNTWLQRITDEERNNFYSWLEANDESSLIVAQIKLFTFGGVWKSLSEIQSDKSLVVLSNNSEPIKPILGKLGFTCSDSVFENHPLSRQIECINDKQLFDEINKRGFQSLSFTDRLQLFKQVSKFYGIGKETMSAWRIFKNQDDDFMPLSAMCAYSAENPVWLNKYVLNQQENNENLNEYLIPPNSIYSLIIERNIDDLLSKVDILEIYNHFRNDWRNRFTITLFSKEDISDSSLLSIAEQSDSETKIAFVNSYDSISLSSTSKYETTSFEYQWIKLAATSKNSILHAKSIITIDGKKLDEFNLKDEFSFKLSNKELSFSLSKILPSFSSSSILSKVRNAFIGIDNIESIFAQREADPRQVYTQLIQNLKKTIALTSDEQFCFLISYNRVYLRSLNLPDAIKPYIRVNDQNTFLRILNKSIELELGNVLSNILNNGGIVFPFVKLLGTYFNCNNLTLPSERTPQFIVAWARSQKRKEFLKQMGLHDENSNEITRRKSFLENKDENIWEIRDRNVIQGFINWVIQSNLFTFPILSKNQVSILSGLYETLRLSKTYYHEDFSKAKEWKDELYKDWKKSSNLSIYIIKGKLPFRAIYNNVYLYTCYQGDYTYFPQLRKIVISNDREPASILTDVYSNSSLRCPFTKDDWNKIFLVSADIVHKKDERIAELERQLEEMSNRESSARLSKGNNSQLSRAEMYEAQLEAQRFLIEQMPHWDFPNGYGESKSNGMPKHFSTVSAKDENGTVIPFVLKSYKFQSEPFKINPEEWDFIIKKKAHLFIYDGYSIREIEPMDLIMNQSNISITFSTENLDIEGRIDAFANALHYFKDLHFDFDSFNISKRAKSIKAIYNTISGTQPQTNDNDL